MQKNQRTNASNSGEKQTLAKYYKLQKEFKNVYAKATHSKDSESIKDLQKYKKEVSDTVTLFSKDHSKLNLLQSKINQGFSLLDKTSKIISEKESLAKKENAKIHVKPKPLPKSKHEHVKNHGEKTHTAVKHEEKHEKAEEKIVDKYELEVDGAKVEVKIVREELGFYYKLHVPQIEAATASLLIDIRNELTTVTTVSMQELTDPKAFNSIKERFKMDAAELIKEKLPNLKPETEKFLVGRLMQEMLGLGVMEFLISDPNLEEIVITSAKEPIRVFSKRYGWVETDVIIGKEEDIINYSNIIARRVGKQITVLSPLLDAHLVTGDRINSVLYPINTKGNTITIRKFARDPYTIIDLINSNTADLETSAILWLAIEYEMNVIISGGTASGKTVLLNAVMPFMPPNHRLISIEDTRELMLPEFLYWTPLVTRTPNPEGKGGVSMLDLLVNSLRMRPDRIILGEMRKHEEAMVLFEAMHTGHSVYATLHADSAPETISRLINPPLSIPANLLKAVNLNVVMFRDRKRGIRRILQIAEIEAGGNTAKANILYRWSPENDKIVKHGESIVFFEDIGRHTGMSEAEARKNIEEKKSILDWLVKNNVRSLDDLGKVMNLYYKNKELLMKCLSQNNLKAVLAR